jgi:hypothetical protein
MVSSFTPNVFGILWVVGAFIYRMLMLAALAAGSVAASPQDSPSTAAAQQGDFFSGIVVSFSATEITVNRKGLGKETEATRTFAIDGSTKVEGAIVSRAHVTVRFMGDESSARAVHILVR